MGLARLESKNANKSYNKTVKIKSTILKAYRFVHIPAITESSIGNMIGAGNCDHTQTCNTCFASCLDKRKMSERVLIGLNSKLPREPISNVKYSKC